jgi:hypothetical protein
MAAALRLDTFVIASSMAVLLGHVGVTTQLAAPPATAFAEASVKPIDPAIRNHTGRQLTVSTVVDRASLLEFIVSSYLDEGGAGACAMKVVLGYLRPGGPA